MVASGVLLNFKVFEAKKGKLHRADFQSEVFGGPVGISGPELAGLKPGEDGTLKAELDIAKVELRSFEFKGKIGVSMELRCYTIKPMVKQAEGA